MFTQQVNFSVVHSTDKIDRQSRDNDYYLIDPFLELTATGRCGILKKVEDIQNNLSNTSIFDKAEKDIVDRTRYWCSNCK
jgi:hypothetical protein